MASKENLGTLDSKYIILDKIGFGKTSDVYLVKEENTNNLYAAKVYKKAMHLFKDETKILNSLKINNKNNPYIVNIINSGEGILVKKDKTEIKKQYIIFEYFSKGCLFDYLYYKKGGFTELHSKFIFNKILKGIESCHNAGICHRDIKIENILINEKFEPKICDFGFATKNDHLLEEYFGTEAYAAPEILDNKPYDGFEADIFSLGVLLFTLNTCRFGFKKAEETDRLYMYIMVNRTEDYWKKISRSIPKLSEDFKKLYLQMISYNPKERPTIEDIFKSDWMKEIQDMNEEELDKLELEVEKEFLNLEKIIEQVKNPEININQQKEKEEDDNKGNKGLNDEYDDENNLFDLNLKPKYCLTGLKMKNYIKINGKMNPGRFMNSLVNEINDKLDNVFNIEYPNLNKLKFNVIISNQENDEDIPDYIIEDIKKLGIDIKKKIKDNIKIKGQMCNIQITLFESYNGGYLLRFVKKDGNEKDFLDNVEKISSLVNQII